jgi:aromatic-L-amino-acid/L-tryptophan decarboxylase
MLRCVCVGRGRHVAEEHGKTLARDGLATLEWLERYFERVRELPVLAQVEPGEIRARLPEHAPEQGEPFTNLLRDLDDVLLPGLTHWQSPRFFAYFATCASEPAILAELLVAGLNNVGILWRTSPALQELEQVTLAWLAELIGVPAGWHGQLEDGASISTIAGLATARHTRPDRPVVVCSEHAHSSVEKACRLLGLEVRKTPADEAFRLRLDALDLTDACAVVATVGTTSSTSVDPVAPIADACEEHGVWLHVDAAYAGSAMVCPEHRWAFEGIERVDSLVVNPHKWLLTTQGCSAFWTRHPDELREAFSVIPEYLRTPDAVVSLSEYGPALGRSFRALQLWAVLRCYGREGLQAAIRNAVGLAETFEVWVRDEPGWELCAPRPFSVVCFRREGSDDDNAALLERVNARGEVFLSHTKLDGRFVLRLAVGNLRTTEEDVRRAWDVLREEAT